MRLQRNLKEIIEGTYVYIQHNQGWESDGKYIGNFTDARLGVSFNYDLISLKFDAGPGFYNPGIILNLIHVKVLHQRLK